MEKFYMPAHLHFVLGVMVQNVYKRDVSHNPRYLYKYKAWQDDSTAKEIWHTILCHALV
jgi:hypothetical protein